MSEAETVPLPEPFYQEGNITIYNADCRQILPTIDPAEAALLLTDPPYGVQEKTQRGEKRRGAICAARDFPPIVGDDRPFDPSHLLRFSRLILWGANHYADRLPPSRSWIVWDKLDGIAGKRGFGFNDGADCELAWSNLGEPVRLVRHRWIGLIRASERERHLHPTQKPVAIMAQLIEHYTRPGDLILDPYMGSGPVLKAAKLLGRRAIGIEISEGYCRTAVRGLSQEVMAL